VIAAPTRGVRIALSLSLLLMIVSLLFLERGINHRLSGSTVQDRGYQLLQAAGLLLLMGSSVVVIAGSIYGARKLVLASTAATGMICLGIAAAFWWISFSSLDEGITLRRWTLALSVPGFVWTGAGAILLLVSGIRFILGKVGGQNQRA
jgi:hypothetical protein